MENFKLGDKIKIPSKKVTGEIVFIGETQFSDGIWFGIVLDKPIGKHNGTINGIKYFKCQRNCGIFIKANYLVKEDIDNYKDEDRIWIEKISPNNISAISEQETEVGLNEPETNGNNKRKQQSKDKNGKMVCGDNIINDDKKNANLNTITESGDNKTSNMKTISLLKKHPNNLKTSSEQRSRFYLRESKCKDKSTIGKCTAYNKHISSVLSRADGNNTSNNDDSLTSKRVAYPNYLTASSKLKRQSDINNTNKTIKDGDTGNKPEISAKMQTSKKYVRNIPDDSVSQTNKYPTEKRIFLNLKEKGEKENGLDRKVFPGKNTNLSKTKPLSKNGNKEIPKRNRIQDVCDKMMELEVVKQENEELKNKLNSTELTLQDTLTKYNKVQNEIKHLKYDNKCQRKQIKVQKNHLKLLKINQIKNFSKIKPYDKRKSNQRNISENVIEEYNFEASGDKFDLEDLQLKTSEQRVHELKEENNAMMQGLIEIRDFLETQYQSQSDRLEFSESDSYTGFSNSTVKKYNSELSFSPTAIQKHKTAAIEESEGKSNDFLEVLQDMTHFNKLIKEKGRRSEDCEEVKLVKKLPSSDTNLHLKQYASSSFIYNDNESTQNVSFDPKFNIIMENCLDSSNDKMDYKEFQNSSIFKGSGIQCNYQTPIDQNSSKGVFKPEKYSNSRKSKRL